MELLCERKYLVLPVNRRATGKGLEFYENGDLVYDLKVNLDLLDPEQHFYLNIERWAGKKLELKCEPDMRFEPLQADARPHDGTLYEERYRPGFHFSARSGWLNDPNGLVYYRGRYLMFFQHNPVGHHWGNMHWGMAESDDLLHWTEREVALYPDERGVVFSGSAIVDKRNATGLKENDHDAILLFYTAAGGSSVTSQERSFTQCLAYSTDGGLTFRQYDRNPVVPHLEERNRDPKVSYYAPKDCYIMALYLAGCRFALLSSRNLLDWTLLQQIELVDDEECPDFYPLPVDDDPANVKWVFSAVTDKYLIGSFDGERFKPETETRLLHFGANSVASQSWSDIPEADGRRIRIAWNDFEVPNMPFNQSMTFPCEMKLRTFAGEPFLCAYPIREIERLYGDIRELPIGKLPAGHIHTEELPRRHYDISLRIAQAEQAVFRISAFGLDIACNGQTHELKCLGHTAPFESFGDRVELRLLADVAGVEIFINGGKAFLSVGFLMDYNLNRLEIGGADREITFEEARIAEIRSIWPTAESKPT